MVFYNKNEYYKKNAIDLKPIKIFCFDVSKSINNDLLKISTIISNSKFNNIVFDVVESGKEENQNNNLINRKKYYPYENYSNNNIEDFNFVRNKMGLENFLKNSDLFFSNLDSSFPFKEPGKESNFSNSNFLKDKNQISAERIDTSEFDKKYVYRENISNLKFNKNFIKFKIEKIHLQNDLICFLYQGDIRQKTFNTYFEKSIGYFDLSLANSMIDIDATKEPSVEILSKNKNLSFEIKNNSKINGDFNLSLLTRVRNGSQFSFENLGNFSIASGQRNLAQFNNKKMLSSQDVFLVIESKFYSIAGKTVIVKLKNSNPIISNDYLNKTKSADNNSLICSIANNSDSILIEAKINFGLAKDYTILKREISLSGAPIDFFNKINEKNIEKSNNAIFAVDKNVKHDRIYEYCLYSLKDLKKINKSTSIFYRNPILYPDKVANLDVTLTGSSEERDEFFVKVNFSSSRFEQILDALLNSTNGNITTSNANIQIGNFIENIKNNRDSFSNIFQINVLIQNLDTGEEFDLGNYSSGAIVIDENLKKSKNIPNIENARFAFRLLQRNAITLFNEIEETIKDKETLKEFKFLISKFLSPLNLISNYIPVSDLKSSKFFLNDEFLIGFTGITKYINRNLSFASDQGNVEFDFRNYKNKKLINISGNLSKDCLGIVIFINFKNIKLPLYFSTINNWKGDYFDLINLKGPRSFEVIEIKSNLTIGKNYNSIVENNNDD